MYADPFTGTAIVLAATSKVVGAAASVTKAAVVSVAAATGAALGATRAAIAGAASAGAHLAQETAAAAGRSWTTQRRAFWKAESGSEGSTERWGGEENVRRMNRGLAPQIEGRSVELHHTPVPQRQGGTQVTPVTPEQHARVDPFRKVKQP